MHFYPNMILPYNIGAVNGVSIAAMELGYQIVDGFSDLSQGLSIISVGLPDPLVTSEYGAIRYTGAFLVVVEKARQTFVSLGCTDELHPHTGGGTMCLGRWSRNLEDHLRSRDFLLFVQTCTAALCTYNPGSPIVPIRYPWRQHCNTCGASLPYGKNGACVVCGLIDHISIKPEGPQYGITITIS